MDEKQDPFEVVKRNQSELLEWRMSALRDNNERMAGLQWATGSGKSNGFIQLAVNALPIIKERDRLKRDPQIWFFTIKSGKKEMMDEIKKWDTREMNGVMDQVFLTGAADERRSLLMIADALNAKYVVMHHNQAKSEIEQLMELAKKRPIILILDEADCVQNGDSATSKAFRALSTMSAYRIAGTGHFMPNRMDSAYHVFQFLTPHDVDIETCDIDGKNIKLPIPHSSWVWGTYYNYVRDYGSKDYKGKLVGISNVKGFQLKVKETGVHVVTKEGAGIKHAKPNLNNILLHPDQLELYERFKKGMAIQVEIAMETWFRDHGEERARKKFTLIAQIMAGRRICALSAKGYSESYARLQMQKVTDPESRLRLNFDNLNLSTENAKANWVCERIADKFDEVRVNGGGGFFIFCEWVDPLNEVRNKIDPAIWKELGGSVMAGEISNDEFEYNRQRVKSGKSKLVIASGKGGRALNLQMLNQVIELTPTWRHTETDQATGRVERTGQLNETSADFLIAENTIEKKRVFPIMANKAKTMEAAFTHLRGRKDKAFWDFDLPEDILSWL